MNTKDLVNWHRKARSELVNLAYLNDKGRFASVLDRYKDWTRPEVLDAEVAFNAKVLTKLHEVKLQDGRSLTTGETKLLIIALKNRMAYASGQADFFPVYVTLIVCCTSFFVVALSGLKVVFLGIALVVVTLLTLHRIDLRNKVTELQQLINLLEAYKDNHAISHAKSGTVSI